MAQINKCICTPKEAANIVAALDNLLVTELFKALSDDTRNLLLSCLSKCGRACSVSEIAECCAVDLSVVSRHLSILEAAGVLESQKTGRTVFYSVKFEDLSKIFRDLANAFEHHSKSKLLQSRKKRRKVV